MTGQEDLTHWKKPKGVLRAVSAFDKRGTPRAKLPPPRLRKVGQVVKAVSILSEKTREEKDGKNNSRERGHSESSDTSTRLSTKRLRKVGRVAHVASILSENLNGTKTEGSKIKNNPEKSNSPPSRGILKNNSIIHKPPNTVKFKHENEINSPMKGRRKSLVSRKLSSASERQGKQEGQEDFRSDSTSPQTGILREALK